MVETVGPTFETLKKNFHQKRSTFTYEWRKQQLQQFLKGMTEMESELCEAVQKDLGRSHNATKLMEIGACQFTAMHDIKHLKAYMKDIHEETELLLAPAKTMIRYEPLGVTAVIGSWNYPLVTVLKPLVQCITAGNAVILKPSEISAHSSKVMLKFVQKYMDQDFIQLIEGDIPVAVAVNKLPLDLMCFTGSTMVGKIIAETAAKNLTPCILELGGKCPCVVDSSCNMEHTVTKLAFSKFSNSGQTCIAPDYFLVEEKICKQFVEALKARITKMYTENPKNSGDMGKIISDIHFNRLKTLLDGTDKSKIIFGGKTDSSLKYIDPTLILDPALDSLVMEDEIFGPICPIIPFKSIENAIEIINSKPKPLAVYYYGNKNSKSCNSLSTLTSSGAFMTNECMMQMISNYQGFGGVGFSGYGRHGGYEGFKCFSNRKGILIKGPMPKFVNDLLVPPLSDQKTNLLKNATFLVKVNQSDVVWFIKVIITIILMAIAYKHIDVLSK